MRYKSGTASGTFTQPFVNEQESDVKQDVHLIVYTCDRCGNSREYPSMGEFSDWGTVNAQTKNGGNLFDLGYSLDLCASCTDSLRRWMRVP